MLHSDMVSMVTLGHCSNVPNVVVLLVRFLFLEMDDVSTVVASRIRLIIVRGRVTFISIEEILLNCLIILRSIIKLDIHVYKSYSVADHDPG